MDHQVASDWIIALDNEGEMLSRAVVRYSLMRSFSTTALIVTTSAPLMPRSVFAASCTAASAALAKLSGDEPMIVITFATSDTCSPFYGPVSVTMYLWI